jgi:hypothetical protein
MLASFYFDSNVFTRCINQYSKIHGRIYKVENGNRDERSP